MDVDREDILSALDDNEVLGQAQAQLDLDPKAFMRGFRAAMILASASVKGVIYADEIAKELGITISDESARQNGQF